MYGECNFVNYRDFIGSQCNLVLKGDICCLEYLAMLNIIIIIISDSVDDRDQKPRYGIEVLLNLSRYQPALGNERINTK